MKISKSILLLFCIVSLIFTSTILQSQNYSLLFDGSSDYITVNNNLGTPGQLSGCCWVKFPQALVEDDFPIIANWKHGSGIFILHYGFDLGVHAMAINLWLPDGHTNFLLESTDYNTWMFVSFTYDGTTLRIYKDGILMNEKVVAGPLPAGASITTIGTEENYGFSYCFEGNIDEVSIWNISLTQSQIQEIMCNGLVGNESGLMGYWKFDEGTGTTTADSSPYSNDGTLFGTPAWSTDVPPPCPYSVPLKGYLVYIIIAAIGGYIWIKLRK